MGKSLGIDALVKKTEELIIERDNMLREYNSQIKELESCIELLSGKPYTEYMQDYKFDDENPNYIRSSQEEM